MAVPSYSSPGVPNIGGQIQQMGQGLATQMNQMIVDRREQAKAQRQNQVLEIQMQNELMKASAFAATEKEYKENQLVKVYNARQLAANVYAHARQFKDAESVTGKVASYLMFQRSMGLGESNLTDQQAAARGVYIDTAMQEMPKLREMNDSIEAEMNELVAVGTLTSGKPRLVPTRDLLDLAGSGDKDALRLLNSQGMNASRKMIGGLREDIYVTGDGTAFGGTIAKYAKSIEKAVATGTKTPGALAQLNTDLVLGQEAVATMQGVAKKYNIELSDAFGAMALQALTPKAPTAEETAADGFTTKKKADPTLQEQLDMSARVTALKQSMFAYGPEVVSWLNGKMDGMSSGDIKVAAGQAATIHGILGNDAEKIMELTAIKTPAADGKLATKEYNFQDAYSLASLAMTTVKQRVLNENGDVTTREVQVVDPFKRDALTQEGRAVGGHRVPGVVEAMMADPSRGIPAVRGYMQGIDATRASEQSRREFIVKNRLRGVSTDTPQQVLDKMSKENMSVGAATEAVALDLTAATVDQMTMADTRWLHAYVSDATGQKISRKVGANVRTPLSQEGASMMFNDGGSTGYTLDGDSTTYAYERTVPEALGALRKSQEVQARISKTAGALMQQAGNDPVVFGKLASSFVQRLTEHSGYSAREADVTYNALVAASPIAGVVTGGGSTRRAPENMIDTSQRPDDGGYRVRPEAQQAYAKQGIEGEVRAVYEKVKGETHFVVKDLAGNTVQDLGRTEDAQTYDEADIAGMDVKTYQTQAKRYVDGIRQMGVPIKPEYVKWASEFSKEWGDTLGKGRSFGAWGDDYPVSEGMFNQTKSKFLGNKSPVNDYVLGQHIIGNAAASAEQEVLTDKRGASTATLEIDSGNVALVKIKDAVQLLSEAGDMEAAVVYMLDVVKNPEKHLADMGATGSGIAHGVNQLDALSTGHRVNTEVDEPTFLANQRGTLAWVPMGELFTKTGEGKVQVDAQGRPVVDEMAMSKIDPFMQNSLRNTLSKLKTDSYLEIKNQLWRVDAKENGLLMRNDDLPYFSIERGVDLRHATGISKYAQGEKADLVVAVPHGVSWWHADDAQDIIARGDSNTPTAVQTYPTLHPTQYGSAKQVKLIYDKISEAKHSALGQYFSARVNTTQVPAYK